MSPTSSNPTQLLGLAELPEVQGGFDATTIILIVLAAVAGYLVYEFIRENKARSGVGLIGAILGHVLFVLFLSLDLPTRFGCGVEESGVELIEFEVAEIKEEEPPPPEDKEPEEEPPEEKEPEEIPKEVKPKQKTKPKTKKAPKPKPEQPQPEKAPPKRWDLSQTTQGGNSGVVVQQGSGGEYGGQGDPKSKGKAKGEPGGGDPRGDPQGTRASGSHAASCSSRICPSRSRCPRSSVRPPPSSAWRARSSSRSRWRAPARSARSRWSRASARAVTRSPSRR